MGYLHQASTCKAHISLDLHISLSINFLQKLQNSFDYYLFSFIMKYSCFNTTTINGSNPQSPYANPPSHFSTPLPQKLDPFYPSFTYKATNTSLIYIDPLSTSNSLLCHSSQSNKQQSLLFHNKDPPSLNFSQLSNKDPHIKGGS